jgi:polyhydroxyalkanoate synthesis repressor PhaR
MQQVQPKVIKRYSNRKLYDTERSCYVTLDEIGQMVKDGVEVRIIDNKTKEDLTSVTLTQIIFAEEKRQKSILPLSTLRNIIQSGGESLSDFFQRTIAEPVSHLKEGAGKRMDQIFKRGEGEVAALEGEVKDRSGVREWFESQRASLEDLQRRIDESMKETFGSLTHLPKIRSEIEKLRTRLDEIEARIAKLEQDRRS